MSDLRYYVKRPGPKRKSYVLVAYRPISRTKKEYVELPDAIKADVDSINERLLAGTVTTGQAEVLLKELIATLYRRSNVQTLVLKHAVLSEANTRVLAKFWADKYEVRYLEDPKSTRLDFERAFRRIEPLSIQTATQAELQNALKKSCKNAQQIRRASDRLNEVLQYLRRDVKLLKPRKDRRDVKHITLAEFVRRSKKIQCEECRLLAVTLFATGARIGEAMALEPKDLHDVVMRIDKQRTAYGTSQIKLPKRNKTGDVICLAFDMGSVRAWLKVQDKWAHRWHLWKQIKDACGVRPHDLRHSHAIHLLTLGANLSDVSLNLRNRIEVCQEYYTGYAHNEGTLERLKRLTHAELLVPKSKSARRRRDAL